MNICFFVYLRLFQIRFFFSASKLCYREFNRLTMSISKTLSGAQTGYLVSKTYVAKLCFYECKQGWYNNQKKNKEVISSERERFRQLDQKNIQEMSFRLKLWLKTYKSSVKDTFFFQQTVAHFNGKKCIVPRWPIPSLLRAWL